MTMFRVLVPSFYVQNSYPATNRYDVGCKCNSFKAEMHRNELFSLNVLPSSAWPCLCVCVCFAYLLALANIPLWLLRTFQTGHLPGRLTLLQRTCEGHYFGNCFGKSFLQVNHCWPINPISLCRKEIYNYFLGFGNIKVYGFFCKVLY